MLLELSVTDFAIIDDLSLRFEPGLNALTGETGAGKSILIDALGAILGQRTGSDVVRAGSAAARIEATFDVAHIRERSDFLAVLDEYGVETEDGVLILSRDITTGGRSSARINGRAATVGMLARLGGHLVDIHGQSDHLSLLRPAEHQDILDRYAGLMAARAAYAEHVTRYRAIQRHIADIEGNARERAQRVDLLRFQIDEIEAAHLEPDEEDRLLAERSVLANAERLVEAANSAYGLLAGDEEALEGVAALPVLDALRRAAGHLGDVASMDASMQGLAGRAEEIAFLLEDIAAETRAYRDRIEADPVRLAAVEDRLDELKQLKRKYGPTVAEVIAFGRAAAEELDELTGGAGDVESLRAQESELRLEIGRRALELSERRRRTGSDLARAVETAMTELNMGGARFSVDLSRAPDQNGIMLADGVDEEQPVAFGPTGVDRVEFLIATDGGETLRPLGHVASGGEMARLMLALKSILSTADAIPTLVFDEVDVGVGGRSGQVVGEKLWSLAANHQVLVITHLPQVAAFANAHFRISKDQAEGRTVSRVTSLAADHRLEELAAMLDGLPVTTAARENARAVLTRVDAWKARQEAHASATSRRARES